MQRLALALAMGVASPAVGQVFVSGNDLFEMCERDTYGALRYVTGAFDQAMTAQPFLIEEFSRACPPQAISAGQLSDVSCQYLRDYPEIRHFPAAGLVWGAIRKAWPCAQPLP